MSKKKIRFILILFLILVLCICSIILLLDITETENKTVCIMQNGMVLYQLDLSVEDDQEIRIEGENGVYNIIEIQYHSIYMKEASCPDQVCVNSGILQYSNLPIVCLPNKVIIRLDEK